MYLKLILIGRFRGSLIPSPHYIKGKTVLKIILHAAPRFRLKILILFRVYIVHFKNRGLGCGPEERLSVLKSYSSLDFVRPAFMLIIIISQKFRTVDVPYLRCTVFPEFFLSVSWEV